MKSNSKLFNLTKKLENDENIKKYGRHFLEYESLNYFNFKNSDTKEFCENLITLKIKLIFLVKVSLFLVIITILTVVLFSFFNQSFIINKNGIIISAWCFVAFAILILLYLLFSTVKTYLFIKKILFFSYANKFEKLKKIKLVFVIFFFSFANLIVFGFITFLISLLLLKQVMNELAKNYESLSITKNI